MNAAVFLDRDNTIIHNDGDLGDPAQVRLIQGAASAIASLKGLGYRIIVASNQGGVARGKYTESDVDAVHERINELVRANSGIGIDRFYYCPYHPEGTEERYRRDHPWRKPRPGMLLQAAKDLGLDLRQSWMIGDQMRDVQAGFSAGAIPILLSDKPDVTPPPEPAAPPGKDEREPNPTKVMIQPMRDYFIVRSLVEAVRLVGQQRRPENVTLAMQTQREVVVPKVAPRVSGASFRADEVDEAIAPLRLAGGATTEEEEQVDEETEAEATETYDDDTETTDASTEDETLRDEASSEAANDETIETDPLAKDFQEEMEAVTGETGDRTQAKPEAKEESKARRRSRKKKSEPAAKATAASESKVENKPEKEEKPAERSKDAAAEPLSKVAERAAPEPKPATGAKPAEPGAPEPAASPMKPVVPTALPLSKQESSSKSPAPSISPAASAPATSTGDENESAELPAEQTLRQILQELRNQRHHKEDFSFASVLAIITQMVAIVCLVAGLLMGAGSSETFLRWIGCAVVLELMTIATLLFRR